MIANRWCAVVFVCSNGSQNGNTNDASSMAAVPVFDRQKLGSLSTTACNRDNSTQTTSCNSDVATRQRGIKMTSSSTNLEEMRSDRYEHKVWSLNYVIKVSFQHDLFGTESSPSFIFHASMLISIYACTCVHTHTRTHMPTSCSTYQNIYIYLYVYINGSWIFICISNCNSNEA